MEYFIYASGLKTLKKDLGNPLLIAHIFLKDTFQKSKTKSNDRIAFRSFHQKNKLTNKWSQSLSHNAPICSINNVIKTVKKSPPNNFKSFNNS